MQTTQEDKEQSISTAHSHATITAYVFHRIHTQTPPQDRVVLFITNVPAECSKQQLRQFVDANYSFSEFGIPWANHGIGVGVKQAPPEIQRAWRSRNYAKPFCEVVSYDELISTEDLPN